MSKGDQLQHLEDIGTEDFIEKILDGKMITEIANSYEVSKATLLRWISADPDRQARARAAREEAVEGHLDKAELDIANAKDMFELQKAREMGLHLRWKASKIAPRDYGDKLQIDQTTRVVNLSEEEILRQRETITKRLAEGAEGPAE